MKPTEHYLAALEALLRAERYDAGAPARMDLLATAQAHAAIATAGAAILSAGGKPRALPELPEPRGLDGDRFLKAQA